MCRAAYFSRFVSTYKAMTSGSPRRSRLRVGVVQFSPKVWLVVSPIYYKNSSPSDRQNSREYKKGQRANGQVIYLIAIELKGFFLM